MISVVIITGEEKDRIKASLESVKWADEIIVIIDADTKDGTLEIVKKYTDKVFSCSENDFSARRNLGIEKAKGDWVLYVDADERVLASLREEILTLVENTDKAAFALSRKNVIFGTSVNYGPYKHDWMIRLFKKDRFKTWVGKVHEYGTFNGELGYTKNSLLHLTHRDLDHIVLKSLDWSNIDAKLRIDAHHPKMTGPRFIRIFFTELFNQGIKRRGFFGGTVGVMDAFLQTFSLYMTYVRLWQMQQSKSMDEIYADIDRKLMESDFKY